MFLDLLEEKMLLFIDDKCLFELQSIEYVKGFWIVSFQCLQRIYKHEERQYKNYPIGNSKQENPFLNRIIFRIVIQQAKLLLFDIIEHYLMPYEVHVVPIWIDQKVFREKVIWKVWPHIFVVVELRKMHFKEGLRIVLSWKLNPFWIR